MPTNMTELRAFHGDASIKAKYIARVRAHRAADELVQGVGYESAGKTRGCAVGCTLDVYDHSRYPIELGIPVELAHLEDFIFESLPKEDAMAWPERFLDAAQPGADLRLVWDRFTLWILTEEHPDRGEHCARMGALFKRGINGDEPTKDEWDRAAWAAWAARDARDARAAWAARDARDARDARAARAAWAARDARDARAAWAARDARDARAAWAAWDARAAWAARDARDARAAWAAWDARDARDARAAWAARDARDARAAMDARVASIKRMADKLCELIAASPGGMP